MKIDKSKLSRYMTTVAAVGNETVVQYHSTEIVRFDDDAIVLDFGGWDSVTTRNKMTQAANEFGLGYYVHRVAGTTRVTMRSGDFMTAATGRGWVMIIDRKAGRVVDCESSSAAQFLRDLKEGNAVRAAVGMTPPPPPVSKPSSKGFAGRKPSGPFCGWPSWNHWNAALWLNDEYHYFVINAAYNSASVDAAARDLKSMLPARTPDGATFPLELLRRIIREQRGA